MIYRHRRIFLPLAVTTIAASVVIIVGSFCWAFYHPVVVVGSPDYHLGIRLMKASFAAILAILASLCVADEAS